MGEFGKKAIDYLYNSMPVKIVMYVINSRTRETVNVSRWIDKQIKDNSLLLKQILLINKLKANADDMTAINILRWINKNITWISDSHQYKSIEYWATCDETYSSKEGDCEDGAALFICLARTAGISEKKIHLAAGNVKGGGHAFIRYKSDKYPYAVFFLDWCYWPDLKTMSRRKAYTDSFGEVTSPKQSNYYRYWFISNDKNSHRW